METVALLSIFETYIEKGMTSDNKKYWVRIRGKGSVPTPAELLDFIYDKYEIEIEGFIWYISVKLCTCLTMDVDKKVYFYHLLLGLVYF